jgi:hypothetical protein
VLGPGALLACLLAAPAWGDAGAGHHLLEGPSSALVPSLELGVGYHSNVWHSPTAAQGAPHLHLGPSLQAHRRREDYELDLGAHYDLRLYTPGTALFPYSRWLDGDVSLVLSARERHAVGFELGADVVVDDPQVVLARSRLRGGLDPRVVFRPASAIDLRLGASVAAEQHWGQLDTYASSGLGPRLEAGPTWELKWRFFPRTALVIEGGYLIDQRFGSTGTLFDIWGGLRGRLTPRLNLVLMAGYGAPTVGGVPVLGGVQRLLVHARLEYQLRTGDASLGYRKDHADPHFTELVAFHRIDGRVAAQPWGRLGYEIELSGAGEGYLGTTTRADLVVVARPSLSWKASPRLSVTGGGGWVLRVSSDPASNYTDVELRIAATVTW